ncbi:helix-turn-helix domain-containing protein [Nakamurella deserti]|uniref:helix-turn-helix domain-containing protein n=1 Tax=Nakamurella deserti TaxID=2164074 RepID=UPI000DBE5DF9|nr:helix-turn-helix domain-containing protein [Nakamurella deserti]
MEDDTAGGFGALLRRLRRERHLTLEHLAGKAQISDRAISNIERGRSRGPQARTVDALADALGLDASERAALLAAAAAGRVRPSPVPTGRCVLPDPVADFTGRTAELATVAGIVADRDRRAGHPRAVVISGAAGLGKTSLAVAAAHHVAGAFPDGVRYLDVRGLDAAPLPPDRIRWLLLGSLGVPDRHVPTDPTGQRDALRGALHDRRMLLVLDNVADEAQVRDVIPDAGPSLTLITSRRLLSGLDHTHGIPLTGLSTGESVALLRGIVDGDPDPAVLAEIARLCGHLPLALRIAGNRVHARPGWTAEALAARLAAETSRLQRLTAGDRQISTAFALSYRQLSPAAAAAFRGLSAIHGPEFGVGSAAAALGLGPDDAETVLDELLELGLLHPVPGDRHGFHDLLRLYARDRAVAEDPPSVRAATVSALDDWLLDTTVHAGRWFEPGHGRGPAVPDDRAPLPSAAAAERWLVTERPHWLAALHAAAAAGRHTRVVEVVEALHWFSDRSYSDRTWYDVFRLGADAAIALGDPLLSAVHLNYLSWAESMCLGEHATAVATAERAAALARRIGDGRQEAWAWLYAAFAARRDGDGRTLRDNGDRAAALFRRVGDAEGWSQARLCSAAGRRMLGESTAALEVLAELLTATADPATAPAPGVARHTVVQAELMAGSVLADDGRWAAAADRFAAALTAEDGDGSPLIRARLEDELGTALLHLGRPEGTAHLDRAAVLLAGAGETAAADAVRERLSRWRPA